MEGAQGVQRCEYQDILRVRHSDGMRYRREGKWLKYIRQVCREWVHEIDYTYHVLGLWHTVIMKNLHRHKDIK